MRNTVHSIKCYKYDTWPVAIPKKRQTSLFNSSKHHSSTPRLFAKDFCFALSGHIPNLPFFGEDTNFPQKPAGCIYSKFMTKPYKFLWHLNLPGRFLSGSSENQPWFCRCPGVKKIEMTKTSTVILDEYLCKTRNLKLWGMFNLRNSHCYGIASSFGNPQL